MPYPFVVMHSKSDNPIQYRSLFKKGEHHGHGQSHHGCNTVLVYMFPCQVYRSRNREILTIEEQTRQEHHPPCPHRPLFCGNRPRARRAHHRDGGRIVARARPHRAYRGEERGIAAA